MEQYEPLFLEFERCSENGGCLVGRSTDLIEYYDVLGQLFGRWNNLEIEVVQEKQAHLGIMDGTCSREKFLPNNPNTFVILKK